MLEVISGRCWKWMITASNRHDGEEAVARVQQVCSPTSCCSTCSCPGIDGLQTLEQLRQIKPGLKVVMLSCVNDTRKVVQAMRLGATTISPAISESRTRRRDRSMHRRGEGRKLRQVMSKSFVTTFSLWLPVRR